MALFRISRWLSEKPAAVDVSENAHTQMCSSTCPFYDQLPAYQDEKSIPRGYTETLAPANTAQSQEVYQQIGDWQTRILELHPGEKADQLRAELLVADLILQPGVALRDRQERVPFEALSYTWGEHSLAKPLILNGSVVISIKENLHSALVRLRSATSERYLWVDSVCINQEDPTEKAMQIANMLEIYKKSSSVVVWLGEPGQEVLSFLNILTGQLERCPAWDIVKRSCKLHIDLLKCRVEEIMSLPYWGRVWIRQELWAAEHVLVKYGSFESSWNRMPYDLAQLLDMLNGERKQWGIGSAEFRIHALRGTIKPGTTRPLLDVLQAASGSVCSDSRDHVYGVVGMSTASHELTVDYNLSGVQVYVDCANYIQQTIGSDRLLTLSGTYGDISNYNASSTNPPFLPSWCPDWSQPFTADTEFATYMRPPRYPLSPPSGTPSSTTLTLSGISIATITAAPSDSKPHIAALALNPDVLWEKRSPYRIRRQPSTRRGALVHGRPVLPGDVVVLHSRTPRVTVHTGEGEGATSAEEYHSVQYILREVEGGRWWYVGWTTWPVTVTADWHDERQVVRKFQIV